MLLKCHAILPVFDTPSLFSLKGPKFADILTNSGQPKEETELTEWAYSLLWSDEAHQRDTNKREIKQNKMRHS